MINVQIRFWKIDARATRLHFYVSCSLSFSGLVQRCAPSSLSVFPEFSETRMHAAAEEGKHCIIYGNVVRRAAKIQVRTSFHIYNIFCRFGENFQMQRGKSAMARGGWEKKFHPCKCDEMDPISFLWRVWETTKINLHRERSKFARGLGNNTERWRWRRYLGKQNLINNESIIF